VRLISKNILRGCARVVPHKIAERCSTQTGCPSDQSFLSGAQPDLDFGILASRKLS
jgi:hypothetical protein